MTAIIGQSKAKSISDIYEQSTLKQLADARAEFGEDSIEFKNAQLAHQTKSAQIEAEYQARKAANQAWLYEQGY